mgnify:CR=1 FL=1
MKTSETIGALAKALAAAQSELSNATKDSSNPHFRSRYADLTSCWDAARDPLTKNGLSVVQAFDGVDAESGYMILQSKLMHVSGEWVESSMAMPMEKTTPQGLVAASTYARRAALCALVGISPADDDGETAEGRGGNNRQAQNGAPAAQRVANRVKPPAPKKAKAATEKEKSAALGDLKTALKNRGLTGKDCVAIADESGIPYQAGKGADLSVAQIRQLLRAVEDHTKSEEIPF